MENSKEKENQQIDKKEQEKLKQLLKKDTIFYSPLSPKTLKNGQISFVLPDKTGKFRITVIGITDSGKYGMHTSHIQIQKPLNAVLEYPNYIRQNDIINLNLILQNNTA